MNIKKEHKLPGGQSTETTIKWLLKGDPAIRWQVFKDLADAPAHQWKAEREKVELQGWGKRLLDQQDENHMWGGGIYGPKWISTHYTLMLLRRMGIAPGNKAAGAACKLLIDKGIYRDGGVNYNFRSMDHGETCVSGMLLNLWSYFKIADERLNTLVSFLLDQQMKDGGWNCMSFRGAKHSSLHTTICALEGLWEYEKWQKARSKECQAARMRAHEFILRHRLFKSDKTGQVIKPQFTRITFPPRWYYDILRALDYFQDCHAAFDERFRDAIQLLLKKVKNGRWPQQSYHPGRMYFIMEKPGQPGRWNTLRALRVMKWWEDKN